MLFRSSDNKWRAALTRFAPLILWIGVIFLLSSPEASMARTSGLLSPILHYLWPNISPDTDYIVNLAVRKLAHFTVYAILAILAARSFALSRATNLFRFRYIFPLVLAFLVASLDEFNQSLEPSRTGLFSDVILDFASACVMTAILWLTGRPRPPVVET